MPIRLSLEAPADLVVRILDKQAVPADIARDVAEHLVESDRVGYASHGISMLPGYAKAVRDGHLVGDARPTLTTDGGVFQAWHGRHGFGLHVGKVVIASGIEAVGARPVHRHAARQPAAGKRCRRWPIRSASS